MNNIEDQVKCIKKFKHFADLVESPEEYFQHMQGHYKELSLILNVFDVATISDKLIEALEYQSANMWIPVNERLPEINKDVQVTFREFMDYNKKYRRGTCKAIYIAEHSIKSENMGWDNCDDCEELEEYDKLEDTYYVKSGWYEVIENWSEYTHVYINCEVTAWKPLPEPYKEY